MRVKTWNGKLVIAAITLAALIVLVAAVPSQSAKSAAEERPGYGEVRSFFKPGAILVLEDEEGEARVPLKLSSELVPEGADGTPDPANTTYVYRGVGQGGSAIVAVRPDLVTISVIRPGGQAARLVVTPDETRYVAAPDEIRGPLAGQEWKMTVPDADTGATRQESALHVAPPGGHSIMFTKHIRASQTASDRKDPVNAVFYDTGWSGNVHTAMTNGGWGEATGICSGSTKHLYLYDAQHGGSDAWHTQLRHYSKEDACASDPRYHLRLFAKGSGAWQDTHSPGFNYYSIGPVHYEDGFAHSNVYPTKGQDKLYADLSPLAIIGNIWWTTVPNSASDCSSCNNWNGLVDFYQVYPTSNTTPDPCNRSPNYTMYFPSDWMVISWRCTT